MTIENANIRKYFSVDVRTSTPDLEVPFAAIGIHQPSEEKIEPRVELIARLISRPVVGSSIVGVLGLRTPWPRWAMEDAK